MATLPIPYDHSRDPMNPDQLAEQIRVALALAQPPAVDISPTTITVRHPNVAAANQAAIQTVINAYVFDATKAAPAGPAGNELAVRLAIGDEIDALRTFAAQLRDSTQVLTTQQLRNGMARLCDDVARLARLQLGRLEGQ